ncbi:transcriptional Coactivator p15-domain-containing protein [Dichotomopilus funicola]|uniref:Transcriptional Coactivator p15-domain-containing protein n=1 Tax=Dichotomopilus funicola TaxID=1934379 RepID=A0AAN6V4K7_9PEZI|nr:transcriptional Coactivator p15-domain-containing protein [Dichotomopilus funicola]
MPYTKKRQHVASDSDAEQPLPQTAKRSKNEKKVKKELSQGTDGDGNPYWEIGNTRRISTAQFKGMSLINIREYYTTPDGEVRPGKKGISLTLDQYSALLKAIPEVNEKLRADGHELGDAPAGAETDASDATAVKTEKSAKTKPQKANIEATSDEEE